MDHPVAYATVHVNRAACIVLTQINQHIYGGVY
jgi:hypothetical protein